MVSYAALSGSMHLITFICTSLLQMPYKDPSTPHAKGVKAECQSRYVDTHKEDEAYVSSRAAANAVSILNYMDYIKLYYINIRIY